MNINEIANMAGVSRATVSRFLNDGYVSDDKKQRIQAVIDATGYQPSAQAQTMRTNRTKVIGVIIPKINSDSISRTVAGISTVLSKAGYQILLANTDNDEKAELNYLSVLKQNRVDGILLLGTIFTKDHLLAFEKIHIPMVIIGQHIDKYSCIFYDDFNAAKELTQLILPQAEHLGYIGVTKRDIAVGTNRLNGFLSAVADAGMTFDADCYQEAAFTIASGEEQAMLLFERHPEIDTLFCATDRIAIGAMNYLEETGRQLPEDIQIVGMGDSQIASICRPKLTTAHYYYKTSGEEGAKLLLQYLESGEHIRKEVKMGYSILIRDSIRKSISRPLGHGI